MKKYTIVALSLLLLAGLVMSIYALQNKTSATDGKMEYSCSKATSSSVCCDKGQKLNDKCACEECKCDNCKCGKCNCDNCKCDNCKCDKRNCDNCKCDNCTCAECKCTNCKH